MNGNMNGNMNGKNNNLNSTEINRELRAVDRLNTSAMPQWRSSLQRLFSDETITTDERASLLGVPSPNRRDLFRMGGITVLGAALIAACGSDGDAKHSGTDAPATTVTPTTVAGAPNIDLVLARTAASLEKLAVDTYGTAAGLITTPAVLAAATMFAGHHQMHLDALNGVLTGAGATAVTEMNQAVYDALIAPALATATSEADAVKIALALEEAAAQTYAYAGGALSTPGLRSTIMTIGGVEARHAAVLRMAALAQSPLEVFPGDRGFFPGDNPLAGIDGALITA